MAPFLNEQLPRLLLARMSEFAKRISCAPIAFPMVETRRISCRTGNSGPNSHLCLVRKTLACKWWTRSKSPIDFILYGMRYVWRKWREYQILSPMCQILSPMCAHACSASTVLSLSLSVGPGCFYASDCDGPCVASASTKLRQDPHHKPFWPALPCLRRRHR